MSTPRAKTARREALNALGSVKVSSDAERNWRPAAEEVLAAAAASAGSPDSSSRLAGTARNATSITILRRAILCHVR